MTDSYKPDGYSSVSPYIMADGAQRLIHFLEATFGATQTRRFDRPDGSVMHAEVDIDGSLVMIADAGADHPAFPVWLHVYVPDVDEAYARALTAGGESVEQPKLDEQAGDRRGAVRDPSGNTWFMATTQAPSAA